MATERPFAPIEAVVFDWYATLGAPIEDGWWSGLRTLIFDAGGTVDEGAIAQWQELPIDHLSWSVSEAEYSAWILQRFRTLLVSCAIPDERLDDVVARSEAIRIAERIEIIEGARATIDALRQSGLAVAVCSNWHWDLDLHLEHNGVRDLFDLVICSAIVGYRKPHPAIFDLVTAGLGVDPERILFVGDDLDADIAGAAAAGMQPVHAGWAIPCRTGHPESVACCTSYDDLLALPMLAEVVGRRDSAPRPA
ncbi:MAG TPA: HAD-IA family hydrolase [Acidimicrobiales bacterium]|nr:HAD-IA family hydrolase [Acidimicrobiales bacterium]